MIKKTLYKHQLEAVESGIDAIRRGEVPLLDCCTGFGKSLVIADLMNRVMSKGLRTLTLVPSEELCAQNEKEAREYVDKPQNIGIVCAGLRKSQQNRQSVIATYQSFLSKRAVSGKFHALFIDEAHLVSPNEDTSIQKIVKSLRRLNPKMAVIGLSGSCMRIGQHDMTKDCADGNAFFSELSYSSDIGYMIENGFLAPLESISSDVQVDLTGITASGSSDYNTKLTNVRFEKILTSGVADMKVKFKEHHIKTAAIYTASVENARQIVEEWDNDNEIKLLHGGTPKNERKSILKWIDEGHGNRYIVNCSIITTGWNMPHLDCVVLFRATKSVSLFAQICGRCLRTSKPTDALLEKYSDKLVYIS